MGIEPVTWTREDHTRAKHELLRAFFKKWVSIHSSFFARGRGGLVRIYDGFAGPGVYAGASLVHRLSCCAPADQSTNLFDRGRSDTNSISSRNTPACRDARNETTGVRAAAGPRARGSTAANWSVTCGRYEENVPQPIVEPVSALFLFLDPFGYSHSPMTFPTQDLVQQPKSDTLIFLPLSFVNRFIDREGQDIALDRFFGLSAWHDPGWAEDRPRALLALFERQLKMPVSTFVPFRLKPARPTNEYFLVGGSGHPKGWASIKDGFWAVDPVNGVGYHGAAAAARGTGNPGSTSVFPPARTRRRYSLSCEREFGSERFTVEEAMALTARSRFLDSHLRGTLASAASAMTYSK